MVYGGGLPPNLRMGDSQMRSSVAILIFLILATQVTEALDYEPPSTAQPFAAPCGCQECPIGEDSQGLADSLYPFSGEYHNSVVDLHIKGRGLDFIWARKYRSWVGPETAQGSGWDYSYNIRIEQDVDDLILYDGNTRQDSFLLQNDGTWAADGFFREFTQNEERRRDPLHLREQLDDPSGLLTAMVADGQVAIPGRLGPVLDVDRQDNRGFPLGGHHALPVPTAT